MSFPCFYRSNIFILIYIIDLQFFIYLHILIHKLPTFYVLYLKKQQQQNKIIKKKTEAKKLLSKPLKNCIKTTLDNSDLFFKWVINQSIFGVTWLIRWFEHKVGSLKTLWWRPKQSNEGMDVDWEDKLNTIRRMFVSRGTASHPQVRLVSSELFRESDSLDSVVHFVLYLRIEAVTQACVWLIPIYSALFYPCFKFILITACLCDEVVLTVC